MYDALAKLYTPLRNEYLELLRKYKQMQLKATSAQEAIDRRDKLEREMKSKNLELADMIRERDRALYDLDRVRGVSSSTTNLSSPADILASRKRTRLKGFNASLKLPWRRLKIPTLPREESYRPCSPGITVNWSIWRSCYGPSSNASTS